MIDAALACWEAVAERVEPARVIACIGTVVGTELGVSVAHLVLFVGTTAERWELAGGVARCSALVAADAARLRASLQGAAGRRLDDEERASLGVTDRRLVVASVDLAGGLFAVALLGGAAPNIDAGTWRLLRAAARAAIHSVEIQRRIDRASVPRSEGGSPAMRKASGDAPTGVLAVIGRDGGLRDVIGRVEQVANTDMPVLLLGETGSGKEVVARLIHDGSPRAARAFIRVNCGAIPSELIDSELFGHEKGSFTGATSTRLGWFERADAGTLFLDEIGELPHAAQVRLLRVIQDGTFQRVGGAKLLRADVRIVAATHRDLVAMVAEDRFRQDLWYRVGSFPIRIPSLRRRVEDLPALLAHFVERAANRFGVVKPSWTEADLALLRAYPWPGNVRELAAVVDRSVLLSRDGRLNVAASLGWMDRSGSHPPPPPAVAPPVLEPAPAPISSTLGGATVRVIEEALRGCRGRIDGPFGAAERLGIHPNTLRARMRRLGIDWKAFRRPPRPLDR